MRCSLRFTPFPLVVVVACAIGLAACLPAHAEPPVPSTSPEELGLLDGEELERLQQIADRLGRRRWGPPAVERFDQRIDPADDPWKVQGAKLTRNNGLLCLELPPNRRAIVWAQRAIQPQLADATGIRIDAWVDLGQAVQPFPRAALYLATDSQQPMRWDYTFYFAYTNTNMQRLQLTGRFAPIVGTLRPRDNRRIHIAMELFDRRVRCWYDGQLVADHLDDQPVRLTPKTVVGFTCMSDAVRVMQLSLRPLAAGDDEVDPAELARASSFDGPDDLTAFLVGQVVPRLGSADFTVRSQTSQMLESLMPLSGPAIRAALAGAADPETRMRLELLLQLAGVAEVAPPGDLDPPAAAKQPDELQDPGATTQPDGEP